MNQEQIDATVTAVATKTTLAGAITSVWGWFVSSEFGVLAGVLIGVAGLLMQWHFKRREDRRAQAEHEARMRKLTRDSQKGDL